MTLCSSQAQQAGFGPRPSIQDTTCFVNKIRDTDRRTQKERARAAASSLFTQTAGAITNVFFHTAFFFSLHRVLLLPFLHASLPVFSSSCLLLCSTHHLSLLALEAHSHCTSLISTTPLSLLDK